jgi:hypothetical protein
VLSTSFTGVMARHIVCASECSSDLLVWLQQGYLPSYTFTHVAQPPPLGGLHPMAGSISLTELNTVALRQTCPATLN